MHTHSDGFTNHSCSPNAFCPAVSETPELWCYDCIAERDIQAGEEITCDYALFDYDCSGHEILQCGCQSSNCRGKMMGFQALTLEEKVRILHRCDETILQRFLKENPKIVLCPSALPEGVTLLTHETCDQMSLAASRKFRAGEVVYTNQAKIIAKDEFLNKTYILKVGGRYRLLDHNDHFIHRPNSTVEYLGFDLLQNHSCEPNTDHIYENATTYSVRASRDILPGESLTVDYARLENDQAVDGLESLPTLQFNCQCGSTNCRGVVIA